MNKEKTHHQTFKKNIKEVSIKLQELKSKYSNCNLCPLSTQGRSNVVFGHGNEEAELMFIGEGPGRDEDKQALPFVGRAGKLLTKIIEAMNLKREEVYISNIVKCRPPKNRAPLPNESSCCKKAILFEEIKAIKPKIICTLGATATRELLEQDISISKVRGQLQELSITPEIKIPVMPTYHPAYLLRNQSQKKTVWEDMKKILALLNK